MCFSGGAQWYMVGAMVMPLYVSLDISDYILEGSANPDTLNTGVSSPLSPVFEFIKVIFFYREEGNGKWGMRTM